LEIEEHASRAFVLWCCRAVVLSCLRAVVQSCFRAVGASRGFQVPGQVWNLGFGICLEFGIWDLGFQGEFGDCPQTPLDNSPFIHHHKPSDMPLTKRQKEILDFVSRFLDRHGYSPTLEEIATYFHLASLNGVYKHLQALQERGFIRRLSNQARSIQLLNPEDSSPTTLPLLGYVTAGQPVEAVVNAEEISVPESFLTRGKNYVLQVRGNSMIDEHIQDGDYVVIEQREDAHNGEMVIALIDGENATLKKFYREDDKIRLQPANPALEPIWVKEDRIRIQGVVVGIMRKYS